MSSASSSSSLLQPKTRAPALNASLAKPSITPQLSVGRSRSRARASRCSVSKKSTGVPEKNFFGPRLQQEAGSERLRALASDGSGRLSKLRLLVRSALSAVPEKPLGLYDPKFDKDSCGVGFVAELSGETSRKTVSDLVVHLRMLYSCTIRICLLPCVYGVNLPDMMLLLWLAFMFCLCKCISHGLGSQFT